MAASLKLVANNAEFTRALAEKNFSPKLHDLPLSTDKFASVQLQPNTSYKALATVFIAHFALLAAIFNSQADHPLPTEQKQQAITVSLLATPTLISEPKIEPAKAEPLVQKTKQKPAPVKTKPELTETPVQTTSPSQANLEQKTSEAIKTEAAAPSKTTEAAPIAATKETTVAEAEPIVEPPKFGAAYLNNPAPKYPTSSRRAGEQGRVLLKVLVSEQGMPEEVELDTSSGFERLDQAAIDAVKKWSFIPAKRSNQPISAYVLVPVKFSLNS